MVGSAGPVPAAQAGGARDGDRWVLLVVGGGTFPLYQCFHETVANLLLGTRTPSPSATVTPVAPSPTPTPARGALLYQAKLDGSGVELNGIYLVGDPTKSRISCPAGAITDERKPRPFACWS
jgi:hypothetical protein